MKILIDNKSIYKVVFSVWFISGIISRTTIGVKTGLQIDKIDDYTDVIVAIVLLLLILFRQNYTLTEISIMGVLAILVLISGITSGNYLLIPTFLFVAAAKDVDLDEIISIAYKLLFLTSLFVLFCYILGFADDYIIFRNGVKRYSLGFSHPNILGLRIFQLISFRCFLHDDFSFTDFLISIVAIVFIYMVPNSLTPVICTSVLVIAMLLRKILVDHYGRTVTFGGILMIVSVIFNITSVVLSLSNQNSNIMKFMNLLLSFRFQYCNVIYNEYGIGLFGNKLEISGTGTIENLKLGRLYLDNAYMGMILWYGIIIYLVFFIGYFLLMKKCYHDGNMKLFISLFVFSMYGVMELGMYIVAQNVFLIAFSYLIFEEKNIFGIREISKFGIMND